LGLGLVGALIATPALSADTMSVLYGSLRISLPLRDLELYAKTGQLQGDLQTYGALVKPQQLQDLRQALRQKVTVSPTLVTQLARSKTGQSLLNRIGTILQTGTGANGGPALQNAVVRAINSSDGLTVINLLRQFPEPELKVDVEQGIQIANEASRLFARNGDIVTEVAKLAAAQISTPAIDFTNQPDPTKAGSFSFQRYSLELADPKRQQRKIPTDIYMPRVQGNAPIIVISHGLASNRNTFSYLARHLASHGFVVVIPEHVGSNATKFQQFFDGASDSPDPREAIDRPLDISFLLDTLTTYNQSDARFRNRLDLDQVGVMGQSFGAFTALALGGAEINFETLDKACKNGEPSESFLNISMLLQCRLQELKGQVPTLRDDRVKAVLAINPVTSQVFGKAGLSKLRTPTMFISGSADLVVPSVDEQFYPFSWLSIPDRYLVLMKNATHFSTLGESGPNQRGLPLPSNVVGPAPELAQRYTNALSLAFFQTHVAEKPKFSVFLTADYSQSLSQPAMPLFLLKTLSTGDLDKLASRVAQRQKSVASGTAAWSTPVAETVPSEPSADPRPSL
jgi:predicted dienelactone hydrolase